MKELSFVIAMVQALAGIGLSALLFVSARSDVRPILSRLCVNAMFFGVLLLGAIAGTAAGESGGIYEGSTRFWASAQAVLTALCCVVYLFGASR